MTTKASYLLSIFLFLCIGVQAQYLRNYTDQDGLAGNNAYYIFQDSRNYLWISTETGVSRFDGFAFQNFHQSSGLSDNEVFDISEDSLGRIWFNTSNGIPGYYKDGQLHSIDVPKELRKADFAFISHIVYHKGFTYIATFGNGVFVYDGQSLKLIESALPSDHISFLQPSGNVLYIFTSKAICGYSTIEKKILRQFEFPEDQHFLRCTKMDREILIKGKSGFYAFNSIQRELKPIYANDELISLDVIHLSMHNGSEIWTGTRNGAYHLDIMHDSIYIREGYLKGFSVSSIHTDHEKNMWFSTLTNGVFMKPYSNISPVKGIHEEIYSLAFDDTLLYAGGNRNKLFIVNNGSLKKTIEVEKSPNEAKKITSLQLNNDSLWLGMEGLTSLISPTDTFSFRLYGRDRLIKGNSVYFCNQMGVYDFPIEVVMKPIVDSLLWYEQVSISDYQIFKGASYKLSKGQGNELYIATDKGVFVHDGSNVVEKKELNQLSKHKAVDVTLFPQSKGTAMATFGSGLIVEIEGKAFKINHQSGLSSDFCRFVKAVSQNQLLVGTENGINLIQFTADSFQISVINHLNGLIGNKCNDAIVKNDSVWVATISGINRFPLSAFNDNLVDVPLRLEGIYVNGEKVSLDETKDLAYYKNSLSLELAAISFKNSDKIRFKYKLNDEEGWTVTSERLIELKSLEPNQYRLIIQACLPNGICSETIELAFTIHLPFWRTNWFIALCFFAFVAVVYLFFRIRVLTYNRDVVKEILDLIATKLKKEKTITFKDVKDGSSVQLILDNISHLESSRNYITIYRVDKPKLVSRITMKEAEEMLDTEAPSQFMRIHKSFIINRKRIDAVHSTFIKIGEEKIAIGRTYQESLKDFIEAYQNN